MFSKLHSHNQIRQRELNNKKTEHTHINTYMVTHTRSGQWKRMRTACKTDALFGWQTLAENCAIQLLKTLR